MTLVATLIFVVLSATAGIHVLWGMGSTWPLRDTQSLINTVVGSKGMTHMPGKGLTLMVAAGIAAAGVCALWGGDVIPLLLPNWMRIASLSLLAAIFLVRGTATYLPFGPLMESVQPFRTLDQRIFAPLILAIGVGYVVLLGAVLGVI